VGRHLQLLSRDTKPQRCAGAWCGPTQLRRRAGQVVRALARAVPSPEPREIISFDMLFSDAFQHLSARGPCVTSLNATAVIRSGILYRDQPLYVPPGSARDLSAHHAVLRVCFVNARGAA
jgi:hypothetical protein